MFLEEITPSVKAFCKIVMTFFSFTEEKSEITHFHFHFVTFNSIIQHSDYNQYFTLSYNAWPREKKLFGLLHQKFL